jgi:hypothetical protein
MSAPAAILPSSILAAAAWITSEWASAARLLRFREVDVRVPEARHNHAVDAGNNRRAEANGDLHPSRALAERAFRRPVASGPAAGCGWAASSRGAAPVVATIE